MPKFSSGAGRWVKCLHPTNGIRARLICFPPAGAGAHNFRHWSQDLPSGVELFAIQLPGRGERIEETPTRDLQTVVDGIVLELMILLDVPCVFVGHSLGSLIAFSVARALRALAVSLPRHLVLAGYPAPHLPRTQMAVSELPDELFVRELIRLGGMPPELLEHKELVELLIPALRADFAMDEAYRYEWQAPLSCGISACGGTLDPDVTCDQLRGWSEHTFGRFDVHLFEGGHFFVSEQQKALIEIALASPE